MTMARFQVRATASGGYIWRLLGSNNRTMAVPIQEFRDRDTCSEHLSRMLAIARRRWPEPRRQDLLSWIWVLTDPHGVVLAQSYVAYSRLVECRHGITRFIQAVSGEAPARRVPGRPLPGAGCPG